MAQALAFFFRQDKNIVRGVFPNKKDGADKSISEAITTPSFGDGVGVYFKIFDLKLAQSGASLCVFFLQTRQKN